MRAVRAVRADYVVVGAGPAGLTIASLLCRHASVVIIESQGVIGGCHNVVRSETGGLFTEHSPRVYSDSYTNFNSILELVGTSWDAVFKPYDVNTFGAGNRLNGIELGTVGLALVKKILFGTRDKTSMNEFAAGFSDVAKDYIDRVCRLTDGTDSASYSVDKFTDLISQTAFYDLYQPRKANDVCLFRIWKQYLDKHNVQVLLDSTVTACDAENKTLVVGTTRTTRIAFDNLIFAIPPTDLYNQSVALGLSFIPLDELRRYAQLNKYIQYISLTYHWDTVLDTRKTWGFPSNDWGIVFVHHTFEGASVLSVGITFPDTKSKVSGLTANESDESQLFQEVFRQINETIQLPMYTTALFAPNIGRRNRRWVDSHGTTFVEHNTNTFTFPWKSEAYPWLYTVGTHTGLSDYALTSMESAVENAIAVHNKLAPDHAFKQQGRLTLVFVVRIVLVFVLYMTLRA